MNYSILSFMLVGIISLQSCVAPEDVDSTERVDDDDTLIVKDTNSSEKLYDFKLSAFTPVSDLEITLMVAGLTDIQQLDTTLIVDLKYASKDNFLGLNMYGTLKRAYLQDKVAKDLVTAHEYLKEKHPHLRFYIFDAVRPVSVQKMMWDALDTIPVHQRVKFVSNPKNGSLHNYGAAIDLSIYDLETDTLLHMGAGYDDLREIAYPKLESHFLEKGILRKEQLTNRKILRAAMRAGGFWVLPTEWWHFNRYNRYKAKELFEVVE